MLARPLRVVHVTDTHLFADPAATLKGVDTERSLARVLAHVREHACPVDLVLATGDLAHDGSRAAYERLKHHLCAPGAPVGWLPGNHDDPEAMRASLAGAAMHGPGSVRMGPWLAVLLNSVVPGDDGGRLGAAELERLDAALRESPQTHALVALHHPPVAVGTPAMDAIGLADRDELFAVLARHANVRALLWGHCHHAFEARRGRLHLMGTPSTCYQMRLGGPEPAIDDAPPGYRRLELTAAGGVATEVVRVP